MSRTKHAFSVLQAIAAVASLAIILWSLGFPVLNFAQAASVTTFSDTLSDSAPSVVSDHTIEFVTPNGVAATETIVITFDQATDAFDLAGIGAEDVDLLEDGVLEDIAGGAWTVAVGTAPDTITLTSVTGTIAAGATTTILIGLHATGDGVPDTQIVNPATVGSYEINVTVGSADSGETRVAIIDAVTVTATVDTIFTFTVQGVAEGTLVNTADTSGATASTTIPFGELEADQASTAAQTLEVSTNAANGFSVTVATDQQLTSGLADIDGYQNGNFDTVPAAWVGPSGTPGFENEAGHWGLSTTDDSLLSGAAFANGDNFVSASTTPVEIMHHNGPTDGSVADEGTATVIYKVEVTALQEAGDYTATLTYVATPVF